jgi:hypothetical protein
MAINPHRQEERQARKASKRLMETVEQGWIFEIQAALDMGADPSMANHQGLAPLMVAAGSANKSPIVALLAGQAGLASVDKLGRNALHFAAQSNRAENVRPLLGLIDATVPDHSSCTPIVEAVLSRRFVSALALLPASDPLAPGPGGLNALDLARQALFEDGLPRAGRLDHLDHDACGQLIIHSMALFDARAIAESTQTQSASPSRASRSRI